jgi:hypothetical protein
MEQNPHVLKQLDDLVGLSTNEHATIAWSAQQAKIVLESRINGEISAEEGADILADLRQQANIALAADDVEGKVKCDAVLGLTASLLTFVL